MAKDLSSSAAFKEATTQLAGEAKSLRKERCIVDSVVKNEFRTLQDTPEANGER
jgi:hypothetical protein